MSLFSRLIAEEAGEEYGGRVRVLSSGGGAQYRRGGGHRAPGLGGQGAGTWGALTLAPCMCVLAETPKNTLYS